MSRTGTLKIRSQGRIRNKSFRIHNTAYCFRSLLKFHVAVNRTREERGLEPLKNNKFVIPKSRYDSIGMRQDIQLEPRDSLTRSVFKQVSQAERVWRTASIIQGYLTPLWILYSYLLYVHLFPFFSLVVSTKTAISFQSRLSLLMVP